MFNLEFINLFVFKLRQISKFKNMRVIKNIVTKTGKAIFLN